MADDHNETISNETVSQAPATEPVETEAKRRKTAEAPAPAEVII